MYERNALLINKKFHEFLLPTILTSMATSLASVLDGVIVGNLLGSTALAAVGLTGPVIYGINMLFLLFAVGGVTCASIARGKRDNRASDQIFTLSISTGTVLLILYALAMYLLVDPISQALSQGDPTLKALTAEYMRPLVFAGPPLMFSLTLAQFMRVDGKPKASAVIAITANAVNLILDYVLIKFFNTGIAGAGLSTALGYVAGALIVIPYLLSKQRSFKFTLPKKSEFKKLIDIIRVGIAKALTQGMSLIRSAFLNIIIMASLGSLGMSAMTVCMNALMVAGIFIGGTSDALLPIVGTLFGERDYFGVRSVVKTAYRVLIIACIAIMAFFIAAPQVMGSLFGITTAEGLAVLNPALRLYALSLPFYGINQLLQNFYSATGRSQIASVIAVLDGAVFVICFALLFMVINPNLLWLAYLCAELCTLAVVLIVGARIRKKQKVSGILLINMQNEPGAVWDVTIPATLEEITGLSEAIVDFCVKNGVSEIGANRMAIAVEEMAANTAKYGSKKISTIDILMRISKDELLLRFRDNGAIFDPTSYRPEEEGKFSIGGIQLVTKLASHMDYARQLGFNTTVLTFERKVL